MCLWHHFLPTDYLTENFTSESSHLSSSLDRWRDFLKSQLCKAFETWLGPPWRTVVHRPQACFSPCLLASSSNFRVNSSPPTLTLFQPVSRCLAIVDYFQMPSTKAHRSDSSHHRLSKSQTPVFGFQKKVLSARVCARVWLHTQNLRIRCAYLGQLVEFKWRVPIRVISHVKNSPCHVWALLWFTVWMSWLDVHVYALEYMQIIGSWDQHYFKI